MDENPQTPSDKTLGRMLGKAAILGLEVYAFICVLMVLLENYFVYPRWAVRSSEWDPNWIEYEPVEINSKDGTLLHAWYFAHPDPRGYIVFFHGNGEDISLLADFAARQRQRHQVSVLLFDYRGYGKSQGRPTQNGVLADGFAAVEWLCQREKLKPAEVILWGRSLGGAVAAHVGGKFGARGMILERTFASMPEAAASLYWWLPVKWLMRNRFRSDVAIANYTGPLLQSHGDCDTIVPLESGRKLFAACPSSNKQFVEMKGIGHNDPNPDAYVAARVEFLRQLGLPVRKETEPCLKNVGS